MYWRRYTLVNWRVSCTVLRLLGTIFDALGHVSGDALQGIDRKSTQIDLQVADVHDEVGSFCDKSLYVCKCVCVSVCKYVLRSTKARSTKWYLYGI